MSEEKQTAAVDRGSETVSLPRDREELLLSAMADQQTEFERFRENVSDRLARIERGKRRSMLDLDPEKIFDYAILALVGFVAVRIALYLFAQFKNSGGLTNAIPMPKA